MYNSRQMMRLLLIPVAVLCLMATACSKKFADIEPKESLFADTMVEMTWPEIKEAAERKSIVLLPVSVVEEHGPHLDLSPDIYLTGITCRYVKKLLEKKGIPTIIAPPMYWGISLVNLRIPGTFSLQSDTFHALLFDIASSLKSWGFTTIFCGNLHGDPSHQFQLERSIVSIRKELGIDIYNISSLPTDLIPAPVFSPWREGKYVPDYHAGAHETSAMWGLYPAKVRTGIAVNLKPEGNFYPSGYVGDPASFKLEKTAVRDYEIIAEHTADLIEAFLGKM